MRAILLAAGKGERLGRLCKNRPKVMLPVNKKPILERNLLYLKRAGFKEVAINLYHEPKSVFDFLKKKRNFGMKIMISLESQLLGTAGAVKKLESYFKNGPFLVLYGDNLIDFDIKKLCYMHRKTKAAVTMGVYDPAKTKWSGVAAGLVRTDDAGRIIRFEERRNNRGIPSFCRVNAGIYVVSPEVLSSIPPHRSFDFARDLFPKLLKKNSRLQSVHGAKYVLASDDIRSYNQTKRMVKQMKIS